MKQYTTIDEAGTHWLVTTYDDYVEVATRRDAGETWSAPVILPALPAEVGA